MVVNNSVDSYLSHMVKYLFCKRCMLLLIADLFHVQ